MRLIMVFEFIKRAAYPVALFVLIFALVVVSDDQNWVYFKEWMGNR